MPFPRQIRNFNAFVDGISYFGRVAEGKLPDLKINTAAFRGAGMDAPAGVDMGMEGMTAELTFAEYPPEILKMSGTLQRIVFRPAAMGEGSFAADTLIFTCGGLVTTHEFNGLKPGENAPVKMIIDLRYYRMEHNGEELWEIDVEAGKRVIGGVDQMADLRRAMGI